MRKTYLARRNALFSSTDLSWGAFAVAFAAGVLLLRLLFPDLFWHIAAPAFRGAAYLSEANHAFFESFRNASELSLRNDALTRENLSLMNENQALFAKVQALEGLSGTGAPVTDGVIAGVVARPPESPYDILLVDKGSDDGIVPGMEAFASGGVPVGVVSTATGHFSRVVLFSSPHMTTNAWVGALRVPLSIEGGGAGVLRARAIRSAEIAPGDIVFVSGPGMLPVGKVVQIDRDPSAPAMELRIAPAVNPFTITQVVLRDTGFVGSFAVSTTTP